jgi:hypothetical protein
VRSKESKAGILFTVFGIGFGLLEVVILGYLVFAPLFLIVVPWLIRRRERQRFETSPDLLLLTYLRVIGIYSSDMFSVRKYGNCIKSIASHGKRLR